MPTLKIFFDSVLHGMTFNKVKAILYFLADELDIHLMKS